MDIEKIVTKAVKEAVADIDWEDTPYIISRLKYAMQELEGVEELYDVWLKNHADYVEEFYGATGINYADEGYDGLYMLREFLKGEIKNQEETESKKQGG